jgi:predicted nucleic acid-binding OB-fold protein
VALTDKAYDEISKIVDWNVVEKAKKYIQIYKRTKSRRIRKKNLKKFQSAIFPEIDRVIETRTKQQFECFATARNFMLDEIY